MKTLITTIALFCTIAALAQNNQSIGEKPEFKHKYRVSIPMIIVPQLFEKGWNDRTHTQHIELHVKRELDDKNIIGVKLATWRLFQPMGILWWDGLTDKVKSGSEYYDGHMRETGIGFSYQRMLWKGLFATAEILPLYKSYTDEDGKKLGNGFKLYNSVHLGYHLAFGKRKQFFVEPQLHSQIWVFDTNTPESFKKMDNKWKNYFLFEPNLYFGFKF
ncbi:MAG: hypothetical protein R2850_11925 [Bacteroidia bacterium]